MEIVKDKYAIYHIITVNGDLYCVFGRNLEISDSFVSMVMSFKCVPVYFRRKRLDAFVVKKNQIAISSSKISSIELMPTDCIPKWLSYNRTEERAKEIFVRYERILKRHKCIATLKRKLGPTKKHGNNTS